MAENKAQRRKNIFDGIRSCLEGSQLSLIEGSADLPILDDKESLKPKIFYIHKMHDSGKPLWAGSYYVTFIPAKKNGIQSSLVQVGGDMGHFCLKGISLGFLIENINNFRYFMEKVPTVFKEQVFVPYEVTEQLEEDFKEVMDELAEELREHFQGLQKVDPEAYWEPDQPYDEVILDILCGLDTHNLEDELCPKKLEKLGMLWEKKQSWKQEIQETESDLALESSFWENYASVCGYSDCGYDFFYDYSDETLRAYELLRVFVDKYNEKYMTFQETEVT